MSRIRLMNLLQFIDITKIFFTSGTRQEQQRTAADIQGNPMTSITVREQALILVAEIV